MPNTPDYIERFREQFPGQLNAIDETGGFDAKPYLEAFISEEIERAKQEDRERIKKYIFENDGGDGFSQADQFIEYIDSLSERLEE